VGKAGRGDLWDNGFYITCRGDVFWVLLGDGDPEHFAVEDGIEFEVGVRARRAEWVSQEDFAGWVWPVEADAAG